MTAALAVGPLAASLAADRQTVMLSAFWTMAAAALFVSVGAWILLARELRVQRRRRAEDGGSSQAGTAADASPAAVPEDGAGRHDEMAGAPAGQEGGGDTAVGGPPGAPS